MEDYHSQYNTLEKRVKRLKRNVKSLETKLEDLNECVELDECVDMETVVDLIQEIVPSIIAKKGKGFSYSSESSEESDSVEIFVVREKKAVPHKQRRRMRPRKVRRVVV